MILVSPKFGISQISSLRNTVVSREFNILSATRWQRASLEVERMELSNFTRKLPFIASRGKTFDKPLLSISAFNA